MPCRSSFEPCQYIFSLGKVGISGEQTVLQVKLVDKDLRFKGESQS